MFFSHSIFQVNTAFQRIITLQLEPKLVLIGSSHHKRLTLFLAEGGTLGERLKTSQVTYVTMVPRVGNETLRPLGVAMEERLQHDSCLKIHM